MIIESGFQILLFAYQYAANVLQKWLKRRV